MYIHTSAILKLPAKRLGWNVSRIVCNAMLS